VQSVRAEAADRGRSLTNEERKEALQDRFLRNADLGRLGAGVTALFAGQDVDTALRAANTALDHNFIGALPTLVAAGCLLWDKLDEAEQEAARETFQEIMEELWEHPFYYMSQVGECLPAGYGVPFAIGNKGYDVKTGNSTVLGATGEFTFETVMGVIGGKAVKGAGKLTRFVASKLKTKLAEKRIAKAGLTKQTTMVNSHSMGAHSATSNAEKVRLRTKLSFEEAGILNVEGKLTERAVTKAKPVRLKDEDIRNPDVVKTLTKDGSKIGDWAKYKTDSVRMPNGQRKQIHFYKNEKTGKVDHETVDFKVKDEVKL
jgi:hypothetical protein